MDNYPLDDRRDALAVLNGGYKRGATIDRCKENGDLEVFSAYCPKAYAGLDNRAARRHAAVALGHGPDGDEVAGEEVRDVDRAERGARRRRAARALRGNGPAPARRRPAGSASPTSVGLAEPCRRGVVGAAGDRRARRRRVARSRRAGGRGARVRWRRAPTSIPGPGAAAPDIRAAFGDEADGHDLDIATRGSTRSTRPRGAHAAAARASTLAGWHGMLRPFKIKPRSVRVNGGRLEGVSDRPVRRRLRPPPKHKRHKRHNPHKRAQMCRIAITYPAQAAHIRHKKLRSTSGMCRMCRMCRTFCPTHRSPTSRRRSGPRGRRVENGRGSAA